MSPLRTKVMVLKGAQARSGEIVTASLSTARQLQDLNLSQFQLDNVGGHRQKLQLGVLLLSLQSLQKLDITSCRHVNMSPSEYPLLRVHSFACHYRQLSQVETRPFTAFLQAFQTREGTTVTPTLQVKAKCSIAAYQHWMDTLPLTAVTHLTLYDLHVWPLPFLDSTGHGLPNLLYFNISLVSPVSSGTDVSFPLPMGSKLQEVYIAGTGCDVVGLAGCASLTSLGLIHTGHAFPDLVLPTSLERLCLHNVLPADTDFCFSLLGNLKF